MADANFTSLQTYQAKLATAQFTSYTPVILMDGGYDNELGLSIGKSISLDSLPNNADALEAARIAYLSMPCAIGYAVRGVDHE